MARSRASHNDESDAAEKTAASAVVVSCLHLCPPVLPARIHRVHLAPLPPPLPYFRLRLRYSDPNLSFPSV